MKLKSVIIPAMMFATALTACNQSGGHTNYPEIEWDEHDYVNHGSAGGFFVEINFGTWLSYDRSYSVTFQSSCATDKTLTIYSSNPNVASVTMDSLDKTKFTINALNYGDTILQIFNAEGLLDYRNIIRVRAPKTAKEIMHYMYETDKFVTLKGWEGYFGEYTFTSTNEDPLRATIKGHDDYETKTVTHNITIYNPEYIELIDMYYFDVIVRETTSEVTTIEAIQVNATGQYLYVYANNSLLVILEAK